MRVGTHQQKQATMATLKLHTPNPSKTLDRISKQHADPRHHKGTFDDAGTQLFYLDPWPRFSFVELCISTELRLLGATKDLANSQCAWPPTESSDHCPLISLVLKGTCRGKAHGLCCQQKNGGSPFQSSRLKACLGAGFPFKIHDPEKAPRFPQDCRLLQLPFSADLLGCSTNVR